MKLKNAFKCAVLIALVICLIAAMIYAGQREKLTAIYYMCISIILFLIYKKLLTLLKAAPRGCFDNIIFN